MKLLPENVVVVPKKGMTCNKLTECAECKTLYCPKCWTKCPKCGSKFVFKYWRDNSPNLQHQCDICVHRPPKCGGKVAYYKDHPQYKKDRFDPKYDDTIYKCQDFHLRETFRKYFKMA